MRANKDLYGIEEFFDNYTQKRDRNYEIHVVKYEHFFDNIETFNEYMEVPNVPELYPELNETEIDIFYFPELTAIYKKLMDRMEELPFAYVV